MNKVIEINKMIDCFEKNVALQTNNGNRKSRENSLSAQKKDEPNIDDKAQKRYNKVKRE